MKKLLAGFAIAGLIVSGTFAQGAPKGAMLKTPQKMGGMKAQYGIVKGAVKGKMFMIANRGGTYTVDASKARVRMNGKFVSLSILNGGSMVSVQGEMKGMKIMASEVNISHLGGKPKTIKPVTGTGG